MDMRILTTSAFGLFVLLPATLGVQAGESERPISWKKTVIEGKFRSEGVAIADVNKDGKLDVLIGDSWYEAPSWTQARHPQAGRLRRRPAQLQRVHDLLGRRHQRRRLGRPDRHRLPRRARVLVREPQGQAGLLASSTRSGIAPATRRRSTPTSSATAIACWSWAGSPRARTTKARWPGSRPAAIRRRPWEMHPVSEPSRPGKLIPGTFRFSHGLGVGDLNGDGRQRRDLHRRLVGTARVGPQRAARPGRSTPPNWATPWPT